MLRSLFFASNKKLIAIAAATTGAVAATATVYKSRYNSSQVEPDVKPPGKPKDAVTLLLEKGSKVLQSSDPLKGMHVYFVGFHPMKDDPCHQMEAHHYCKQVNEDFAQCVLYDSNTQDANLTGIECIISEALHDTLPEEERQYWHPHNAEILSGQLVAPGLPAAAEKKLLEKKMNSYGKTYHTWRARCWEGEKPYLDTLPQGEAILAWSFNHEGEAKPGIVETRDKKMSMSTEQKRKEREDLVKLAHPQEGVNYLASKFKKPLRPIPGVVDTNDNKLTTRNSRP